MKNKAYQRYLRSQVSSGQGHRPTGEPTKLSEGAMGNSLVAGYKLQNGDTQPQGKGKVQHFHTQQCPCDDNGRAARKRAGLVGVSRW